MCRPRRQSRRQCEQNATADRGSSSHRKLKFHLIRCHMPTEAANPIRCILHPTDFSPASGAAFEYAERLAACTGARLLVLHVHPGWNGAEANGEVDVETMRELTRLRPRESGVDVEHIVHRGAPGEVICWVAQERQCDQIVMGTHGRTGLASVLMGSVAEHVIRNARCPVVTVRLRPENEQPLEKPQVEILVPPVQSL
ncbi:MAG: universal stress protein [Maioricimonas sp. JB049]